jgi:ArsR family transcriptional regulator, arsenate/arsenite/antimonite-responsive transcriptional repressor
MMDMDKKVIELEKIFKAFASRRRIAIIRYVRSHPKSSLADVAENIRLPYKTTSKHAGVLINAGILDREQRSTFAGYILRSDVPEYVRKLLSLI